MPFVTPKNLVILLLVNILVFIKKPKKYIAIYLISAIILIMNSTIAEPTVRKNPVNKDNTAKSSRQITPKLVCIITGTTRLTNAKYIASKPQGFVQNYISRPALKLLRQGKTITEVRSTLNVTASLPSISDSSLQNAIKINGKWAKA